MAEENNTVETGVTEDTYASMLSEAINHKDAEIRALKETQARTVKELTDKILNARPAEESKDEQIVLPTDEQLNDMRKELFDTEKELTNLEYVTKALELRDVVLAKEGKDIFVGRGSNFEPTQDDYYRAENTAKIMKECVDYAQGDSAVFTTELNRRMKR